ncbi:iron ABC transporter permease [Candidatus Villigracilis saccharophilus]|uniref:ABC transporter permease n=1 Tax=Candidatus Villigracilis saccharophilus TaxID=3140684 RepID=UPI0031355A3E|nr:iron ABC transporter permease [Anaerolineales bacterium]
MQNKDLNHEGTETLTRAQKCRDKILRVFVSPWFVRISLWLAPILFLLFFFFQPLARIITLVFDSSAFTQKNFEVIRSVAGFTFYQAILSTVLTFALGLPSAILFSRFNFHGKSLLRALTAVPFMLPTVVVASSFNALFGNHGLFSFFIPHPSPFILILTAHIFYNTTIVIRIVGNALSRLDPKLEAAARSLGADSFHVWKNITLPLLRPSLLAAALLVFMFDFTSFGVILLLGGSNFSTLEVEIYLRVLKLPNLPLAALLSIIQLIFTLIFSILYTRTINQVTTQTAPRFSLANKPKNIKEKIFVAMLCILLSAFFLLPLLSLPIRSLTRLEADRGQRGEVQYGFTTDYYKELFINRRGSLFYVPPIQAAFNSLGYASVTVFLSLALGYPAAYALAKPTRLEKFLDPLIMLPLGSSAVMLGLGFIISFGRSLASPWFVPIAHTLVALPFVIRTLQPALASIPERLRQAASTLGASPFRVWQTVDFPILSRATLSAATFAFTVSLGEFGATLLLTRPEYPTIPIAIQRFLSQPGGLNFGQAMAMATLLMLLTTLAILAIEKLRLSDSGEF